MPAFVRPGAQGVDFSFARPPAARLLELGYTFVVGYISVPPASPKKNLSKAECEAYIDAGLKVLLVWEMDAARPNKGATYGAIDGKNAARRAGELGYPTDVPILCAADLNTIAANIDSHEAYMRAFAANCVPWPMGIYGDTDILDRCQDLWQIGWVPVGAWAWSGSSKFAAIAKARAIGAHVLQSRGFHIDNVWAVDPNDVIAPFPAWGAAPAPDPWPPPQPPPSTEADMPYVIFELVDSKAAFWGQANRAGGPVLAVRWSGPGSDLWLARRAQMVSEGTTEVRPAAVGNLATMDLQGALPDGDPDHVWDGSEFANAAELQAVNAPVAAEDQVARDGVDFCRAELATQAAEIDAAAMRDERDRALFIALGTD